VFLFFDTIPATVMQLGFKDTSYYTDRQIQQALVLQVCFTAWWCWVGPSSVRGPWCSSQTLCGAQYPNRWGAAPRTVKTPRPAFVPNLSLLWWTFSLIPHASSPASGRPFYLMQTPVNPPSLWNTRTRRSLHVNWCLERQQRKVT